MIKACLSSVVLLACLGCAGPPIASRAVHNEASWFVRLDTFAEARRASDLRYDHPVDWSEAELNAILSRLLLQDRVGLLEQKPPPRPVFSPGEISQLVPKLQAAFHMARPSEWVVFYFAYPTETDQKIVSGGFFLQERHLHVILANHRKLAPAGPDGTDAVRANPMRALGGKRSVLTFDPPHFVLATPANEMGGVSAPAASEIVLDYQAFLGNVRPPAPASVASSPPKTDVTPGPSPAPPQKPAREPGDTLLKDQMTRLQQEVERLTRIIEEQKREIARLQAQASDARSILLNDQLTTFQNELTRLNQKIEAQEKALAQLKARLTGSKALK